ncbi:MAG: flagellar basal body-associated protein FliL [Sulfurospirillaceae bacterium]|nr:flagellar basal body-associated protein FliL [Sulfurospirillaceae bacterium]MDD3463261.1 flagellar basal body-associated protein FliL [Sulfurospirillaceae bacterium]
MAERKTEEKEEETKKPKGNMILILVIALLVLLLLGGGAAAYFILGGDSEVVADNPKSPQAQSVKSDKKKTSKRSTDLITVGPMYPMKEFIVNLLSESGSRFLKVSLDFELSDAKLASEMDHKKSLIRDIIIRSFSSKTFEDISTIKGKDRLKDEVVEKINDILSDGYVKNMFFTDFVVQ